MSDLDWLETLAKFAVPAIWLALKVFGGIRKNREASPPARAPQRLPGRSPPQAPVAPTPPAVSAQALGMLARLHSVYDDLAAHAERIAARADARGPRGELIGSVLDTTVRTELGQLHEHLEHARSGGLLDGSLAIDLLRFRFQRLATQLQVLETASRLGDTPALDAVMADAEAIADACLAPLRQFADFHDVVFPPQRPLCLPAELAGGEAAWIGLLGMGVPLIFVPDDFEEDLMRWPSIAHEIGHVLLNGTPGLQEEMGKATGWTARPDLLRVERGQIVGSPVQAWSAWREELFCDALTVLMLGPAALDGFRAVFACPEDPRAVLTARAQGGRYAPHPPAHLRVHLAAFLLEEVGFIQEGRAAARAWNQLHGFPEVLDAEDGDGPALVLPLADGRVVGMNVQAALDRGTHAMRQWLLTQYERLAGHSVLSIPGFDLGPGLWARVERTARALREGSVPDADGRVLLAAAIHAGAEPGAPVRTISEAVQHAIIGRGEGRRARRARVPDEQRPTLRDDLLDALLLQEILERPRPGTRPARALGRR